MLIVHLASLWLRIKEILEWFSYTKLKQIFKMVTHLVWEAKKVLHDSICVPVLRISEEEHLGS